MKVFAGTSNSPWPGRSPRTCKIDLGNSVLERFSDGEIHFYIDENVRGEDVFVIQSGCVPGQRPHDGAVPDDRRLQAVLGRADHGRHALLRLRPAGLEGPARGCPSRPA